MLSRCLSNPSPCVLVSAIRAYRKLELRPISPDLPRSRPAIKTFRRLTTGEVERAITAYEAGAKLDEVAAQFGVHRHTVASHIKATGVRLRYAALTDDQIVEARQLYDEGRSFAQIGEQLGKDPSGIWRAFKLAGIPRRDAQGRVR